MSLSVQHLSDEAVAAFADGVLGGASRARAQRHIEGCAECAWAVTVQREAAWALRSAPLPSLPADLLERLRQVPLTTSITPPPMSLAPDGSAVFPAFGTVDADPDRGRADGDGGRAERARVDLDRPTTGPSRSHPRRLPHLPLPISVPAWRRAQQVALVSAALAVVAMGFAASGSSAAVVPSVAIPATGASVTVRPAIFGGPRVNGPGDESILQRTALVSSGR